MTEWLILCPAVVNPCVSSNRLWVPQAPRGSHPSAAQECTSWTSSWREDTIWPSETGEVESHLLSLLFCLSVPDFMDLWRPYFCFLGSSDPYVKFKLAGKEVFRSRTIYKNLNPVWDEKTTLIMDCLSEPLYVKVRTASLTEHTDSWWA